MAKKLEIFKPGTHIAMNGATISFTEADLAATIAAYNPAIHEAPLVVGHPGADAPAYGWVKSLSSADSVMLAEPDQVDAAFAELVNAGTFKKVSSSFYLPTAPNNPVPGVFYLRHVGFLGGHAPAVKGLKSASFAEQEEGVVEFGDWNDRVEAGLFRSLRDWIIGKFGSAEADKALPSYDVSSVEREAAQPDQCCDAAVPVNYSEHHKEDESMTAEQLAAQKALLDKQALDFSEREKVLTGKESAARHTEHISFAEGLVKEGKLLPAQKDQAVAMLDCASTLASDGVVEFGEGDGKSSLPLADSLKTFLSGQPTIVAFGEHAKTEDESAGAVNFTAPPGYTVDAAGLELHTKALAYQQKNSGVDYMAAVKMCQ